MHTSQISVHTSRCTYFAQMLHPRCNICAHTLCTPSITVHTVLAVLCILPLPVLYIQGLYCRGLLTLTSRTSVHTSQISVHTDICIGGRYYAHILCTPNITVLAVLTTPCRLTLPGRTIRPLYCRGVLTHTHLSTHLGTQNTTK